MALRDDNPNAGKLSASRLNCRRSTNYAQGSNVKRMGMSNTLTVKRCNAEQRGSGIMPAILQQETAAMSRAKFLAENHHDSGLSCFEAVNA